MKRIFSCIAFFSITFIHAQSIKIQPTNWWVGMKWNKVQLLIKGEANSFNQQSIQVKYAGVKIDKVHRLENGKYMAVDVSISPTAKPGDVYFEFIDKGKTNKVKWSLQARRKGNGTLFARGVNSSDFIYFLMPDRFSNGDVTNDKIAGMRDQTLNRDSIYHRHGGDLQGVINHLDYFESLGATALWLTPVLENDMPNRTEHGYAFTDHFSIEPRFGGAEAYKKLSDELHKRGMKLIQDAVYNHVGNYHFTYTDQPMKDWYHQWPKYTNTTYKDQPLFDPYASKKDAKLTLDGWFTPQMPDLNQSNPYVANYLIQHAIWSVEEFGVDGWRIDTYIYNDLPFMNKCNAALIREYPSITMFGETWIHGVVNQGYFVENNLQIPFKSNLHGATDFQTLFYGIYPAMNDKFGWTDGVNRLYTTLAQDLIYKDPMRHVIFLDNHDISRFFSVVREDVEKQKMGIAWLLTARGIPQMYYGTEILMKGETNPDGWVRLDFAGGWKGDKKNAFTGEGLTAAEKDVQDYTRKLGLFRKNSSAIKTGKLMQYVPENGLYVYFRYNEKETIMCVMNTSENEQSIDFKKYEERTQGFKVAEDVVSGKKHGTNFTIPAKKLWVLSLKN